MVQRATYTLRREDIQDMVDGGTICSQHTLIQALAQSLKLTPSRAINKSNGDKDE